MMTLKNGGLFLLAPLLCFNISTSHAFDVAEDVAEASDSSFFERYPRSKIDEFKQVDASDYLLALASPKTVNGLMKIEYSERLSGELTRITYRSPDGDSSEQVFNHFRSQLDALSHVLLFECHDRECGSSNQWANGVFGIPKLYGPKRYQHYLAAQMSTETGPLFVALYSIQRGNKRVYTQLDLLAPDSQSSQPLGVNPETILKTLKDDGVFNLKNLAFDNNDALIDESKQRLKPVITALNKNTRLSCYVVGHLSISDSFESLKARSLTRAESVVQALVEAGVSVSRLNAQGVGPLAPGLGNSGDAGRISLVLQ